MRKEELRKLQGVLSRAKELPIAEMRKIVGGAVLMVVGLLGVWF